MGPHSLKNLPAFDKHREFLTLRTIQYSFSSLQLTQMIILLSFIISYVQTVPTISYTENSRYNSEIRECHNGEADDGVPLDRGAVCITALRSPGDRDCILLRSVGTTNVRVHTASQLRGTK